MKKLLALLITAGILSLTTGCPPAETTKPAVKPLTTPGGKMMPEKMTPSKPTLPKAETPPAESRKEEPKKEEPKKDGKKGETPK